MIRSDFDNHSLPIDDLKGAKQADSGETNHETEPHGKDKDIGRVIEYLDDYQIERIISHSELINSGNNGLIYKMDSEILGEEIKKNEELMKLLGEEKKNYLKSEKVFKILKIYKPGLGRKEFEMQKKAYDVVNNAPNKNELAQIPNPISIRDIAVSKETRDELNKSGASLSENKIELIVMDFVPGTDLATTLYQWVIDNHSNQQLNPGSHQNIEEMQQTVAMLLGYERPGGKGAGDGDRNLEERKVYGSNADKLYNFLKKSGFKMDPSVTNQVRNTLNLLHRNGVYHNDPHERNIIISDQGAHIIDFGSADSEKIEGRVDDGYLINRLQELTDSPEAIRQKKAMDGLDLKIDRLKQNAAWELRCENLFKQIQENADAALENEFARAVYGEDKLEEFIAIFLELSKKDKTTKDKIANFINEKTKPVPAPSGRKKQPQRSLPPWVSNKLRLYKHLFE